MESLVRIGSPPEKYWPYDVTRYDEEPAAFLYSLADDYEAINYFRLDPTGTPPAQTLDMLKMCLDAGFPAMFGFPVYAEFMTPQASGKVPFPGVDSQFFGGHAVIAAGYDDKMSIGSSKGAIIVRNSWGTGWGKEGYCYMSYDYVTEALALDFWTLISANWVDDGQFA
jgi:C1A family cysteine protease